MLTEKAMLSTSARPSAHESFENPPSYNLSQEDVLAQAPIAEEEDLWTELDRIQDPGVLKQKFYAEHRLMREQLSLAGQFGLELQQSLEMAQRAERQSYAQLQALQDENVTLQARVQRSRELSDLQESEDEGDRDLTAENENLQKELNVCRRELKTFRKELDNLVDQMTEMGTEVVDAKNKVSVYARRLTEMEQELSTTQEVNIDLQEQLRMTTEKQKQTQSSTVQAMKNMQNELGKVLSDSGSLRSTLVELETRQDKCEGKVVEMISNTKEYANLLEEAQTTIQTLRTESDMEGRGWGHHHPAMGADWNRPARQNTAQMSTLAMEDPELNDPDFPAEEMDPHAWNDEPEVPSGMSLGMELGLGVSTSTETDFPAEEYDVKEETEEELSSSVPVISLSPTPEIPTISAPVVPASSTPVVPASSTPVIPQPRMQPSPEPLPQTSIEVQHKETQTPVPQPQQPQQRQQQVPQQPLTPPGLRNNRKLSNHSIPPDFQQRLNDLSLQQSAITGVTRPPWNPSVALEPPVRNRSRSTGRGPSASFSSASSSRSVSQSSQYPIKKSRTMNAMPTSSQTSPPMSTSSSSSSLLDGTSGQSPGRRSGRTTANGDYNTRPRSRTTAATVEKYPSSDYHSSTSKGSRGAAAAAAAAAPADFSAPKVLTGKSQSQASLSTQAVPTNPSEVNATSETGRSTPRSPRPASLSPVPGARKSMESPSRSPVPQSPTMTKDSTVIMGGTVLV
ncbi:hypothetical protein BGX31_007327 [Mortierella sp. GBA43]|nr:hypothetical protein BGX31_007327 [Mortierella sp. GBA43]